MGMDFAEEIDIKRLKEMRVLQQKDDWNDEFVDKNDLVKRTEEYLMNHLNKDLYILVERFNHEIIATCGIQLIEYMPQCNDNGILGYICNVYTNKEYRNKGIQTKLLKQVIDYAKMKKVCEIQLSTDNQVAIGIYKKLGFVQDEMMMKLVL